MYILRCQGQGWRTMGEGAEERCKVVFLREQALLQSYFSSQVTADQLIPNNVNETECCHECCTTRLARLRAARHEQVRTAKSRRRHRCRTLPRATRAARTSLTRHAGEVFYSAADTTHARRNVSTRADRPDVLIMGGSFYYNCHYATSDLDLNPRALHHIVASRRCHHVLSLSPHLPGEDRFMWQRHIHGAVPLTVSAGYT